MLDELDGLFDAARILASRKYPGKVIDSIAIDFTDGKRIQLPASVRCHTPDNPATRLRPLSASHSPDFRTVNYYGHLFRFTPSQAPAVQLLWEAMESESDGIGQAALLEASNTTSNRLHDVFKRCPAWGTLIIPGDRAGTYRLASRDEFEKLMSQEDENVA